MTARDSADVFENNEIAIVGRLGAPDFFVDGVTQIQTGFPVSRLVFHTLAAAREEPGSKEIRKAVLSITMSTVALVETCMKVLDTLKVNEAQLLEFNRVASDALREKLASLHLEVKPPPSSTAH